MRTSRSRIAQAAVATLGLVAWVFYAAGLSHKVYFSSFALSIALVVAVVVSASWTRQAEFPQIATRGMKYWIAHLLHWFAVALLLFAALLAVSALPVFLVSSKEAHVFNFVRWEPLAYRPQRNLNFICRALVVAESSTHMPGRQVKICVDEFPAPRDRIKLIEVDLKTLGYITLFETSKPLPS